MKKITLFFVLALLSAAASASAKPEKNTTKFDGKERTYYTFAPEKISAPAPLLLLLHGSGRDGMTQIDEWKTLAEKEGLVLVAPNSLNSREWSMSEDRPDFFHEIIEATKVKYPVDGKRMYVFGHSAGAVFALYMGVMESQYFAAVGVHAGAMRDDFFPYLDLAKRKLPLAIWVGTEDAYFSLAVVRNTQNELKKHGFDVQVFEIKGHDHNYYAISKDLNPKIWAFLNATKLEAEPNWQTYLKR